MSTNWSGTIDQTKITDRKAPFGTLDKPLKEMPTHVTPLQGTIVYFHLKIQNFSRFLVILNL